MCDKYKQKDSANPAHDYMNDRFCSLSDQRRAREASWVPLSFSSFNWIFFLIFLFRRKFVIRGEREREGKLARPRCCPLREGGFRSPFSFFFSPFLLMVLVLFSHQKKWYSFQFKLYLLTSMNFS